MKKARSVEEHYSLAIKRLHILNILLLLSCGLIFIIWATEVYFNNGGGRLAEWFFIATVGFVPPILLTSALQHFVTAKTLEYLERSHFPTQHHKGGSVGR